MRESTNRMTEPGNPPGDSAISDWIGKKAYKYWKHIAQQIEQIIRVSLILSGYSEARDMAGLSGIKRIDHFVHLSQKRIVLHY